METDPTKPLRIDPQAIYDDASLVLGLGFTTATLARERRSGRLRYLKRGQRILYRGQDVSDWLTADPTPPQINAAKGGTDDH